MKLFFTDLDGTLLNRDGIVTKETLEAIHAFTAAGNKFIISSGRSLSSIEGVVARAGLPLEKLTVISYNGSYVYDYPSRKALIEYRIPMADVQHFIDECDAHGQYCHAYTDTTFVARKETKESLFYADSVRIPAQYSKQITAALTKEPFKLLAINLEEKGPLEQLQKDLQVWIKDRYATLFSCDQLLEFIDLRSGKGNAVRTVCEIYGIDPQDAYAAGDAGNDLSMLQAVGHSIAMANATDEIKAIASMITAKDHDHDGLSPILRELSA